MNITALAQLATTVQADLEAFNLSFNLISYSTLDAEFQNLMNVACDLLPEHKTFFTGALTKIQQSRFSTVKFTVYDAISIIEHLLKIIEIEKAAKKTNKRLQIFDSADEKMKQSGICYQNEDYPSVFHCLNTAFELILKDKLSIPLTISKINTSNIVDILVKEKVGCYLYLAEAKKHVLTIDNKIKHQAYAPSKVDCITAIKAMEDLIDKLRDTKLELTAEIKNKIYNEI